MYATLFKCCRKRISDYPNLSAWLRDVYQFMVGGDSQLQVSAYYSQEQALLETHPVLLRLFQLSCLDMPCTGHLPFCILVIPSAEGVVTAGSPRNDFCGCRSAQVLIWMKPGAATSPRSSLSTLAALSRSAPHWRTLPWTGIRAEAPATPKRYST